MGGGGRDGRLNIVCGRRQSALRCGALRGGRFHWGAGHSICFTKSASLSPVRTVPLHMVASLPARRSRSRYSPRSWRMHHRRLGRSSLKHRVCRVRGRGPERFSTLRREGRRDVGVREMPSVSGEEKDWRGQPRGGGPAYPTGGGHREHHNLRTCLHHLCGDDVEEVGAAVQQLGHREGQLRADQHACIL